MDVPGHPRVRGGFQAHLSAARGVVFVLDSVDFLPRKTETAECVAVPTRPSPLNFHTLAKCGGALLIAGSQRRPNASICSPVLRKNRLWPKSAQDE